MAPALLCNGAWRGTLAFQAVNYELIGLLVVTFLAPSLISLTEESRSSDPITFETTVLDQRQLLELAFHPRVNSAQFRARQLQFIYYVLPRVNDWK